MGIEDLIQQSAMIVTMGKNWGQQNNGVRSNQDKGCDHGL